MATEPRYDGHRLRIDFDGDGPMPRVKLVCPPGNVGCTTARCEECIDSPDPSGCLCSLAPAPCWAATWDIEENDSEIIGAVEVPVKIVPNGSEGYPSYEIIEPEPSPSPATDLGEGPTDEAVDLAIDLGGAARGATIVLTVEQARELVTIPDGIADWSPRRCRRALAQQAARARNLGKHSKETSLRARAAEEAAREAKRPESVAREAEKLARVITQAVKSIEGAAEKVRAIQEG